MGEEIVKKSFGWNKLFGLIILIVVLFYIYPFPPSEGYVKEKGEWYFSKYVVCADFPTIKYICGGYYKKLTIENQDFETFEIIKNKDFYFAKDKNNLYYKTNSININESNVDLNSIEHIYRAYLKDKNKVYLVEGYKLFPLNESDPSSFVPIDRHVGKDNFRVYYYADPILNADSKTFKSLTKDTLSSYYSDKNNVYYIGRKSVFKLENVNPITFKFLTLKGYQTDYSTDGNNIYYKSEIIKGIDLKTARVVHRDNIKDDYNLYYKTKLSDRDAFQDK